MFAHGANSDAHDVLQFFVLALGLDQLGSEVQGRHHGDTVEPDDFAAVANLAHLRVQKLRRSDQGRPFRGRTGNLIFLL